MLSAGDALPFDPEDEDSRCILFAMTLRWTWITMTQTLNLIRTMGFRKADSGYQFTSTDVTACWSRMRKSGILLEDAHHPSQVRLSNEVRNRVYRELLAKSSTDKLREALHASEQTRRDSFTWPFHAISITAAVFRLEVFSGTDFRSLERMRSDISRRFDWSAVLYDAFAAGFDGPLFDRISLATRAILLFSAIRAVCADWRE